MWINSRERTLTCPVCGKEFTTKHPSKKYCSRECCLKVQSEKWNPISYAKLQAKKEAEWQAKKHTCVICGKEMDITRSQHRTKRCDECNEKYMREYRRKYNREYYHLKKIGSCCVVCGKDLPHNKVVCRECVPQLGYEVDPKQIN